MMIKYSALTAQALFPNGLYQPAGSFRFSVDALLLASFMDGESEHLVADFGAGCGVVGLAYLLKNPEAWVMGFENQKELVGAANLNARSLECGGRYACINLDLACSASMKWDFSERGVRKSTSVNIQLMLENMPAETADGIQPFSAGETAGNTAGEMIRETPDVSHETMTGEHADKVASKIRAMSLRRGGFDLVLSNPPYRLLGSGRLPHSELRQRALFAPQGTVEKFCSGAHALLASHGRLGLVFPAKREDWIRMTMTRSGFEVERVLRVHGREGKPATLILLEGRKKNNGDPPLQKAREEAPLVLYDQANRLTERAVRFCPYLG